MGEARRLLAIPGGISVGMSGEGRDGAAALHLPCMKGSDMGALEALHPSAEGGTPPTITTTLLHSEWPVAEARLGLLGVSGVWSIRRVICAAISADPVGSCCRTRSNCPHCHPAADVGVLNTTGDPRPHGENMTRGTSSGVAQLEEARGGVFFDRAPGLVVCRACCMTCLLILRRIVEEKRPMTFKEFTLHKVPDDAAPDVAHRMFQEYLVDYYGSAIKAEFEQNKDSDMWVVLARIAVRRTSCGCAF